MAKQVIEPLRPDISQIMPFLEIINPLGSPTLVAISETGKVVAKTFANNDHAGTLAWVEKKNHHKFNIYFHVNPLKPDVIDRKAKKSDIDCVTSFHVDLDDPSNLASTRLQAIKPKPTVILFSGGGYQAFWKLDEPLHDMEKAEAINRGLALALGADDCFNVDRIMRLPGTINWPNAKKRAAGRTEALAYVIK
jgi:hypothetical protein